MKLKKDFIERWSRYFPDVDLPIVFFYTDQPGDISIAAPSKEHQCMIRDLGKVRHGKSIAFSNETLGCSGARRYLGFDKSLRPNFEYFLSCGIPGKLEGERYKKSPELVAELMKNREDIDAPGKYIVFKRWDQLTENDQPEVVIFFVSPDVLSGLFTLSTFDESSSESTIAPFAASCATIVQLPYLEGKSDRPRTVLGHFDISARPYVPADALSFAAPMVKFERMVANMDESFLITESWKKVRKRIEKK